MAIALRYLVAFPLFTITGLLFSFGAETGLFRPESVPAAVELSNPERGLYTWLKTDLAPQAQPSLNRYVRLTWAGLEPQENQYDFSDIDKELALLPHGVKFAFRIVALNSSWSWKNGSDVPEYLVARLHRGFFVPVRPSNPKGPSRLYIPDWNDPYFLERVLSLLGALGSKYDGDSRIAWVDIGIYGNWGEWHMYVPGVGNIPYGNSEINRNGAEEATLVTRKSIVDAHARAFRKTRLLMMTDDKPALAYALGLPLAIPAGMRRDSFGSIHFAKDFVTQDASATDRSLILNRWKIAPLIVESIGGSKSFEVGPEGLVEQVKTFHVAAIGNGGFSDSWQSLTQDKQQAILSAARASGYRYSIREVHVPSLIEPGGTVTVHSEWENSGVTPTYEPWNVRLSLNLPSKAQPAAEIISRANLQTILPTAGKPVIFDEPFAIPDISPGAYELRAKIVDPAGYAQPLQLSNRGRNTDGSYTLGGLQISERMRK